MKCETCPYFWGLPAITRQSASTMVVFRECEKMHDINYKKNYYDEGYLLENVKEYI